MKLPSIQYIITSSKKSFLRFPFTILSALAAVCVAIYMVELETFYKDFNHYPWLRILLTAVFGIPLYFCAEVRVYKNKRLRVLTIFLASILLGLIYYSLPNSSTANETPYVRYCLYTIAIHLIISFTPFLKDKNLNGFWNYNKTMFLRILKALLFSGVLYLGIVLAILIVKELFSIKVHNNIYTELFIVLLGLFNTWFFVSGIPEKIEELEQLKIYPNSLKIFSQYILVPLLIIYLIILYAYGTKIIISWDWPRGGVSYLISIVSIVGIFTLLLMYPYGNLKGNNWIRKFSKIYYIILIPLIVILFIAIGFRIESYGLTINRYLILIFGVWLTLISIYFAIGKTNIKLIPISLALLLFLITFGSWGMFSTSLNSQTNRLIHLLEENHLIENGHIKNEVIWELDSLSVFYSKKMDTNKSVISKESHEQLTSILDYLNAYDGFNKIQPLFQQNIDSLIQQTIKKNKSSDKVAVYMKSMGLRKYTYEYKADSKDSPAVFTSFYFNTPFEDYSLVDIKDYDYYLKVFGDPNTNIEFKIGNEPFSLRLHNDINLQLSSSDPQKNLIIDLGMQNIIGDFGNGPGYYDDLPRHRLTFINSNSEMKVKIELSSIELNDKGGTMKIKRIRGYLLIKNFE